MTWGRWYWPLWLAVGLATFLGPEIAALVANHNNTLSDWVWTELKVDPTQKYPWTAAHLLVFGAWCVVVYWLTFHFFFRRYV